MKTHPTLTRPESKGKVLIMLGYLPFPRGHYWEQNATQTILTFVKEINELDEIKGGVMLDAFSQTRVQGPPSGWPTSIQQSCGELSYRDPPPRTPTIALQIAGFSPEVSCYPCRHLQHLQCPTPSHQPLNTPSSDSQRDGNMGGGDGGGMTTANAGQAAPNLC